MKIYHLLLMLSIFSLMQLYILVAQGNVLLYKNAINGISRRIFLQKNIKHLKLFFTPIYKDISIRKMHPPNKPHPDPVNNLIFFIYPKIV